MKAKTNKKEKNSMSEYGSDESLMSAAIRKKAKWGLAGVAALGMGAYVIRDSYFTVDPNDRANVRYFGNPVYAEPLQSGLHFKFPFVETVDKVQTALTTQEIPSIEVGTVDNQRVTVDINFNYDIPDKEVDRVLYHIGSVGNKGVQDQVEKTVQSVAVDVIATENMNTLNSRMETVRQEMETETFQQLKNLYGIEGQRLQIKSITPSDDFIKSNEAAVNAKNAAVAAENQLKTVQFVAQQAVAQAQGASDSVRVAAEGDKAAAILKAEGEKQAAILEGEGNQARYQAEISALGGPGNYIEFKRASALSNWDGKLPQVMGGNGAGSNLVLPILKLDQQASAADQQTK